MPHSPSAKKMLRKRDRLTRNNRFRKRRVHDAEKEFLQRIEAGNVQGAQEALVQCFSALDRAARGNSMHKRKADRKKSQLHAKLQALSS